jgi:hypothetical protein
MCQEVIAETEVWSTGPSKSPVPWTQANSAPERSTPWSVTVCPEASTSLLPETCSAGAAPGVPVGLDEGLPLGLGLPVGVGLGFGLALADGDADGLGDALGPQAAPFTVNEVGAAFAPL